MNNYEKRDKYALLNAKLKKATYNEYYYEAIFIEYAIMEDRTESLLKHANIDIFDRNGYKFTLDKKIKKIESNKIFKDKYIQKHLTNELWNNIKEWKNVRNKLIHNLIGATYENEDIKNLALQGECLVKRLSSKSSLVNKKLNKIKKI